MLDGMTQYVAFLRGVNVGGINMKMVDVRKTFATLGFDDVRTILASGNVLFTTTRTGQTKLKSDIEAALRKDFGYDAWIVLCDIATVRAIVDAYPFDPEHEGWQPYVMLSSDAEILGELLAMKDDLDPALERIDAGDGVLYWEVERGQTLHSDFGKATGKKRYKATTTTRNLRTLLKVIA